jgi:hypothetical protein
MQFSSKQLATLNEHSFFLVEKKIFYGLGGIMNYERMKSIHFACELCKFGLLRRLKSPYKNGISYTEVIFAIQFG